MSRSQQIKAWVKKGEGSKWVRGPAPDLPARRFRQVVSTLSPRGLIVPMPVITTRLLSLLISISFRLGVLSEKGSSPTKLGVIRPKTANAIGLLPIGYGFRLALEAAPGQ